MQVLTRARSDSSGIYSMGNVSANPLHESVAYKSFEDTRLVDLRASSLHNSCDIPFYTRCRFCPFWNFPFLPACAMVPACSTGSVTSAREYPESVHRTASMPLGTCRSPRTLDGMLPERRIIPEGHTTKFPRGFPSSQGPIDLVREIFLDDPGMVLV